MSYAGRQLLREIEIIERNIERYPRVAEELLAQHDDAPFWPAYHFLFGAFYHDLHGSGRENRKQRRKKGLRR